MRWFEDAAMVGLTLAVFVIVWGLLAGLVIGAVMLIVAALGLA